MTSIFDVIVVGAGPSGSTVAYFLAQNGLRVLLLDKAEFPRDKTCGDGLPPRAMPILEDMGILNEILKIGWKLDTIKVSAPSGKYVKLPLPPLSHAPSYALITPRLKLDNILRENAVKAGAVFYGENHVYDVETTNTGVIVKTKNGTEDRAYYSNVAVLATGTSTRLLVTLGILQALPPSIVAARAYYENIKQLDNDFHFHFANVHMPGYGWIFPLSETSANIGTGFITTSKNHKQKPPSPQAAFDKFIQGDAIKKILQGAERVGPVKGYPLRIDFATAPTYAQRLLLVGESAGLVNPLTGDGIDYALETGKIASKHIANMFTYGDFSENHLKAYDTELRDHYQILFKFCDKVRRLCLHNSTLNMLVPIAAFRPKLAELLIDIVLGSNKLPKTGSSKYLFKEMIKRIP